LSPVTGGPVSWMPVVLVATSLGGLMLLVGLTLAIRRRSRPVAPVAPVWWAGLARPGKLPMRCCS